MDWHALETAALLQLAHHLAKPLGAALQEAEETQSKAVEGESRQGFSVGNSTGHSCLSSLPTRPELELTLRGASSPLSMESNLALALRDSRR